MEKQELMETVFIAVLVVSCLLTAVYCVVTGQPLPEVDMPR